MRNRRKSIFGNSVLQRLRVRFRIDGLDGLGGGDDGASLGGGPSGLAETPDVPPVNGGPDRSDLANATIDLPAGQAGAAGAGAAPARRTPADPNQRAGFTPPAETDTPQWQSIRDAATAQGFRFDGSVTDDRTALNYLLAAAGRNQQSDVYAQLGRQLAPQANQIQAYLQQQTQPQQPAGRPAWEAPEFDERWAGLVELDPTSGLYTSKLGVPHEIAQKVNAYVEWKKNYDRNPAAVINGMVEARAKAVADSTFREQFAAQAREQTISQIVSENQSWMYQRGPDGQPVRDYRGQFVPSPIGQAYLSQLQAVQAMGVTDPRQQNTLAMNLVRGQYAQAAQQQAWAAHQQAANPQTQAALGAPNRNPLQSLPPAQRRNTPGATEPTQTGKSVSEQLREAMAAEGVTDADIYNSSL